jgi:hypothetical protein
VFLAGYLLPYGARAITTTNRRGHPAANGIPRSARPPSPPNDPPVGHVAPLPATVVSVDAVDAEAQVQHPSASAISVAAVRAYARPTTTSGYSLSRCQWRFLRPAPNTGADSDRDEAFDAAALPAPGFKKKAGVKGGGGGGIRPWFGHPRESLGARGQALLELRRASPMPRMVRPSSDWSTFIARALTGPVRLCPNGTRSARAPAWIALSLRCFCCLAVEARRS